jgi:hypothetical protein
MAKSPNWTEEELAILAEAYPRLGKSEELKNLFPNRTLEGICLKANRKGFKRINSVLKRKTNEEYLELVQNTNFKPLDIYKGSTVPILHSCKLCGHEWMARPQQMLRPGALCPKCSLKNRFNSSSKVSETLEKAGFIQLSDYTGALDPLRLKHKHCGYEWDTVYSYIQQGSGCPVCNKGFGYSLNKDNMPEVAYIYLFHIKTSTDEFLKIGVTSRNIERRKIELKSNIPELISMDLLHCSKDRGANILIKEICILDTFKKHTCSSTFAGSTELLDVAENIDLIKEIMDENI